jgi:hypothetical protein
MIQLQRATSGFHSYGSGSERRPNKPTHAAEVGARRAICGAFVEQLFLRGWGALGPETGGCPVCQTENIRLIGAAETSEARTGAAGTVGLVSFP